MAKKAKATTTTTTRKKSTKKTTSADENIREFNLIDDKFIEPEAEQHESASESMKVKKISHFDIINYIFTDIDSFNNLTNATLKNNFFMLNRTMSIKYPAQAAAFNTSGVNTADATRVWSMFVRAKEGSGKVPSFVYTKGAAKSAQMKNQQSAGGLSKETIADYCRHYHLSNKDFKDMLEFWSDRTVEDVLNYEKRHKSSENGFKKVKKSEQEEED